ncbi:hypothetical protein CWB96_19825 [Pseudoalteromonas citrea]|uniref:Uncharacterized protein n=2 Tax=Pseudoalteromonas TaxID=53246 RepID=A0A5S3XKN7_9GAMM|nr:hypothetical protein [Pseudoalteromonas citrea]TMP40806.1 hypothetical protein CWB97_16970 [Pseudoalteromonas citrea]TMP54121.1 hypothetical protein CWB96_19825 [Pseudoalteromonas citrea]
MPADIMTLQEFKNTSSHWSQVRSNHKNLVKVDNAITSYHAIGKDKFEQRIVSLTLLSEIAKSYADDKRLFVWQDTRRKRKISAADAIYNQAITKIKYLEQVLVAEKRLPALLGVGDQTPIKRAHSGIAKWAAATKQVQGLIEYIGKPSDGRQLDPKYWTEAIDPLHRHWKNPINAPIFTAWTEERYEQHTTVLPFYRWLEMQSDETISGLSREGLLSTSYQDAVGREEYRRYFRDGLLKYLRSPAEFMPWSSQHSHTNFCGTGWAIFVLSPDDKLYTGNHDSSTGWFHAAFLGGKPVKAAGEIYVKNGVPLVITDKSGHYKPQFEHLCEAARVMNRNGVDISQLQIWCRWVDPVTGKSFAGKEGMRANDIWYMSIDAERYINTGNRGYAMIQDFSIKSGSWGFIKMASPDRVNLPEAQQRSCDGAKITAVAEQPKGFYRGWSIDRYCTAPHFV